MSGPVVVHVPVQWGDMDALGHVNNTVYLRWFESARIALFDQVGLASVGQPTVGPILASTSCQYRKAVTFPATAVVTATVARVGRTSHVQRYTVHVDGELCADGEGVIVLVNYPTGTKVENSAELRARLEAVQ